MLVLGIETTCDETACAVVQDGLKILSNVIVSQGDLHTVYGGVVPELACRRHIDVLLPIVRRALKEANVELSDIDLIAAAKAPGLIGALLIGLNCAKTLALALGKPFIGVNHLEAHLYAATMTAEPPPLPALGVVISGGHTALLKMENDTYTLVSQTVDDAIGEAFDKVAALLGLPYPGGPAIEEWAKKGNKRAYPFKAGQVKGRPLDFSFSGLKTGVLYAVRGQDGKGQKPLSTSDKCDIAASFQWAAFQDLMRKTLLAAQETGCRSIIFGGGVSASLTLRELFSGQNWPVYWPAPNLSTDNAAMIAGLAYWDFGKRGADGLELEALSLVLQRDRLGVT